MYVMKISLVMIVVDLLSEWNYVMFVVDVSYLLMLLSWFFSVMISVVFSSGLNSVFILLISVISMMRFDIV